MTKLLAMAAFAACLLCAGDVKGTWTGQVNRPDGTKQMDLVLELKQDGDAVSGRVGPSIEQAIPIQKAKLAEDTLTFEVQTDTASYNVILKLDGDSLKGGAVVVRDGQSSPSLPIEMKRSAK